MRTALLLGLAISAAGTAPASAQGAGPAARTATTAPTAPVPLAGTFLAHRIDASPLPLTDRVTDTDGTTYLVEIDRLVLSLRANQRFRASVRFRRTLYSRDPRGRNRPAPLQTMTVVGTYAVVEAEIRFTPDPSAETGGLRMLSGRVEGARRLSLPFDYRNGTAQRHRTLVLLKDDSIL